MKSEIISYAPKLIKIGLGISAYVVFKYKSNIRENKLSRFHEVIDNEDYENALWRINSYIEENPKDSSYGYYYKGVVFGKMGNYDEAIAFLKKSIEEDEKMYEAYKVLGDLHANKGDFDEALKMYKKVKKRGINGSYYINKGYAEFNKGAYRKALFSYKLALYRYRKEEATVYDLIIRTYEEMNDYNSADKYRSKLDKYKEKEANRRYAD